MGFSFIDLFAGIGGFHLAAQANGGECIFASEIDTDAAAAYEHNFGLKPVGDITKIKATEIPDHDMLCAGFPCQPFSIIGNRLGFDDIRGTLFFEIDRILQAKRPPLVVLENVKQLATHDGKRTINRILDRLSILGYSTEWKILNALDYGLPQKRERTIIVGFLDQSVEFSWPEKENSYIPLEKILEKNVDAKHYASPRIRRKRKLAHKSKYDVAIWHENKGGNISSHPFSCALRASASYNYLLVNGERRLTPRELLRLQGFPDSFEIVSTDVQLRKQAGNALPVPMLQKVISEVLNAQAKAQKLKRKSTYRNTPSRSVSKVNHL